METVQLRLCQFIVINTGAALSSSVIFMGSIEFIQSKIAQV
jgi:hypothetical protein